MKSSEFERLGDHTRKQKMTFEKALQDITKRHNERITNPSSTIYTDKIAASRVTVASPLINIRFADSSDNPSALSSIAFASDAVTSPLCCATYDRPTNFDKSSCSTVFPLLIK